MDIRNVADVKDAAAEQKKSTSAVIAVAAESTGGSKERLVTASQDGIVCVWDVLTGQPLKVYQCPQGIETIQFWRFGVGCYASLDLIYVQDIGYSTRSRKTYKLDLETGKGSYLDIQETFTSYDDVPIVGLIPGLSNWAIRKDAYKYKIQESALYDKRFDSREGYYCTSERLTTEFDNLSRINCFEFDALGTLLNVCTVSGVRSYHLTVTSKKYGAKGTEIHFWKEGQLYDAGVSVKYAPCNKSKDVLASLSKDGLSLKLFDTKTHQCLQALVFSPTEKANHMKWLDNGSFVTVHEDGSVQCWKVERTTEKFLASVLWKSLQPVPAAVATFQAQNSSTQPADKASSQAAREGRLALLSEPVVDKAAPTTQPVATLQSSALPINGGGGK